MKSNFNFKIPKEIREFCQHERRILDGALKTRSSTPKSTFKISYFFHQNEPFILILTPPPPRPFLSPPHSSIPPPPTSILHTQKTLLASGITRDDLFLNSMPVVARDVKSIDRMQHADSKQIVMTTSIYLQSYKTATLFSTRNHSFCFNSESRLSQIFLLGR